VFSHRAGLVLMLLAAVCIGLQAFFVKLAAAYTGPAEIALLGVLLVSMLGQMGMTIAYRHISTTEGGVMSTVGAAVGSAMGILFLHEKATPGLVAGSLPVILSGIYLTLPHTAGRAVRS
jgi:drug/metabolite transporter (DMT)-like permease